MGRFVHRHAIAGVLPFLLLVGAAQAGIHKCVIDGKPVYQDQPCPQEQPAAAPAASSAPTAPAAVPPGASVAQADNADPRQAQFQALVEQIRLADAEYRALQAKMRTEGEALEAANKQSSDTKAANAAVLAFNQRWNETMAGATQRREQLQRELQVLCPNGAVINDQRQECR